MAVHECLRAFGAQDAIEVCKQIARPAGIAIDRGYFEIAHHILGVRNQRQALTRRDVASGDVAEHGGGGNALLLEPLGECHLQGK